MGPSPSAPIASRPSGSCRSGAEFNQSGQTFDLDEDERLSVETRSRSVNWLVVRSAGEHWSYRRTRSGPLVDLRQHRARRRDRAGGRMELLSVLDVHAPAAAAAVRRRRRRSAAITRRRCSESSRRRAAARRCPATYEQREPWGTLEGRVEFSNYFPGLSTNRVSVDAEANVRDRARPVAVARGLGVADSRSAVAAAPRRDAGGSAAAAPPVEQRLRDRVRSSASPISSARASRASSIRASASNARS